MLHQPQAAAVLGPLVSKQVIAVGGSQPAVFLTTSVKAVDPIARVYDGFLIHSGFGAAASLDGTRKLSGEPTDMPPGVRFRTPRRVPVLALVTETGVAGGRMTGYSNARQPDNDKLRVSEVAGTAHADNYLYRVAFIDSGLPGSEALAKGFARSTSAAGTKLATEMNPGLPHHYVVQAALAALDNWVGTGRVPPKGARLASTAAPRPNMPAIAAASPRAAFDRRGRTCPRSACRETATKAGRSPRWLAPVKRST